LAQEKVFAELSEVFANSHRPCTTQDVASLKYLECCIKETLRLYPSVPAIMRRLTEDVQTGKLIDDNSGGCFSLNTANFA
jgi:cytochrome P450 family 4